MSHSTKQLGTAFIWGGWIIFFIVLALVFQRYLDGEYNPNRELETRRTDAYEEIVLRRNRQGHYLLNGQINGKTVTFLVDTGATTTSLPLSWAKPLGLPIGPRFQVSTANGTADAYLTTIDSLKLGDIEFRDIKASLNPGLDDDQALLGMNVIKRMDLLQRGDLMVLRKYRQ